MPGWAIDSSTWVKSLLPPLRRPLLLEELELELVVAAVLDLVDEELVFALLLDEKRFVEPRKAVLELPLVVDDVVPEAVVDPEPVVELLVEAVVEVVAVEPPPAGRKPWSRGTVTEAERSAVVTPVRRTVRRMVPD